MKTPRSLYQLILLTVATWAAAQPTPTPAPSDNPTATPTPAATVVPAAENVAAPTATPAPSETLSLTPVPSAAVAPAASVVPTVSPAPEASPPLRSLTADTKPAPTAPPAPTAEVLEDSGIKVEGDDQSVGVLQNSETFRPIHGAVVSVLGNSHAHEDVHDAVVAVLGNSTADKMVGDSVVAVLGNATANGEVHHDVVAVLGNVELGPNAIVHGDIVSVGGQVRLAPGAVVQGHVHRSPFPLAIFHHHAAGDLLRDTLFQGRMLSLRGPGRVFWPIALIFLAIYLALAALFPNAVTKCATTLEERPGRTIGVAFLAMLATPLIGLLMIVTIVPALFFVAAYVAATLVGKAAFLLWIGRRIWRAPGVAGATGAVMYGGAIMLLLYTIPVIGLLAWKISGTLGFGMAIYTALMAMRREKPARPNGGLPVGPVNPTVVTGPALTTTPAPVMPVGPVASEVVPPVVATPPPTMAPPVVAPPLSIPPVLSQMSYASLPRAGFWIRTGAAALDFAAVAIVCGVLGMSGWLLFLYTCYCVVFWTTKGTTIGGIICGLRVVRLDDRPMDWSIAIVRALGAFLSAVACFLGFIWVAVDPQSQSWHDKIAGTTIVLVPQGTSLI